MECGLFARESGEEQEVEEAVVERLVEEEVGGCSFGISWGGTGLYCGKVSSYEVYLVGLGVSSECPHGVRVSWLE